VDFDRQRKRAFGNLQKLGKEKRTNVHRIDGCLNFQKSIDPVLEMM
jgi:hypothetical protein